MSLEYRFRPSSFSSHLYPALRLPRTGGLWSIWRILLPGRTCWVSLSFWRDQSRNHPSPHPGCRPCVSRVGGCRLQAFGFRLVFPSCITRACRLRCWAKSRAEEGHTTSKPVLSRASREFLLYLRRLYVLTWMTCRPKEPQFSCVFHVQGNIATFEGAPSSFSFPFEVFDEMFVTKSGIVVVVIESSGLSTTVLHSLHSARSSAGPAVQHLRSGLTSGFFLNELGSSSSSSPSSPPKLRSFVSL
jgi:hypothetical protein